MIERYDSNEREQGWIEFKPSKDLFPERQGLGVIQINNKEILVFGGYLG